MCVEYIRVTITIHTVCRTIYFKTPVCHLLFQQFVNTINIIVPF